MDLFGELTVMLGINTGGYHQPFELRIQEVSPFRDNVASLGSDGHEASPPMLWARCRLDKPLFREFQKHRTDRRIAIAQGNRQFMSRKRARL